MNQALFTEIIRLTLAKNKTPQIWGDLADSLESEKDKIHWITFSFQNLLSWFENIRGDPSIQHEVEKKLYSSCHVGEMWNNLSESVHQPHCHTVIAPKTFHVKIPIPSLWTQGHWKSRNKFIREKPFCIQWLENKRKNSKTSRPISWHLSVETSVGLSPWQSNSHVSLRALA